MKTENLFTLARQAQKTPRQAVSMYKMPYRATCLTLLVLFLILLPMAGRDRVSADTTVHIDNVYVNSSNNLYVTFNGVHNYYRLYVRRVGAIFGDPGKGYYQIYPGGTWPKNLWIVTDVNPNTVYCAELRSNDGAVRHDIVAYRTGSGSKPYYGTIIHWGSCPEVDGNTPPNVPKLVAPGNGSVITNPSVTLRVEDRGDPDNYPRTYRDYRAASAWARAASQLSAHVPRLLHSD